MFLLLPFSCFFQNLVLYFVLFCFQKYHNDVTRCGFFILSLIRIWSLSLIYDFFLTNFRRKFGNFRRKYGDIDYSCSVLTHFFLGESSFKCFELVNIFPQVSEHSCFLIKKTLLLFRSSNFFCYLFYFIFCFIAI